MQLTQNKGAVVAGQLDLLAVQPRGLRKVDAFVVEVGRLRRLVVDARLAHLFLFPSTTPLK